MLDGFYELPLLLNRIVEREKLMKEGDPDADEEDDKSIAGNHQSSRKKKDKRDKSLELPRCDLRKSIALNIFLIISSRFGEHRFDETYGCEIWDLDFEVVSNESSWINKVRKSVQVAAQKHEKRLEQINVDIAISMEEYLSPISGARGVKRKLTIVLKAKMLETGEDFVFNTNIFVSPLSLD
jgi:phage baseplate assembly protein W